MVRFIGLPTMVFKRIVAAAVPFDEKGNRGGCGRPRWLDIEDIIDLGLRRLQVFGKRDSFEPEFGLTRTSASRYLDYAERILAEATSSIHAARFGQLEVRLQVECATTTTT